MCSYLNTISKSAYQVLYVKLVHKHQYQTSSSHGSLETAMLPKVPKSDRQRSGDLVAIFELILFYRREYPSYVVCSIQIECHQK